MSRSIVSTAHAPKAVGTYSQAVKCGSTVYLSGQIPLDPVTGELVQGPIEEQVRRVFENMQAVVTAAGGTFAQVAKVTVFLCDLTHFPVLNKVMAEYFSEPYPARSAVQVAALPKGAQVEIECVLELG